MKLSETVQLFLNNIKSMVEMHPTYCDCLKQQDDLTQDILHKLELEDLGCYDNMQAAEALAESRRQRRYYKDRIEEAKIIIDYMDKHQKAINDLGQLLGKIRKVESYHENRSYNTRSDSHA